MIRNSQLYGQLVFQKRNERIRQRKRDLYKFPCNSVVGIVLIDQGSYAEKLAVFHAHFDNSVSQPLPFRNLARFCHGQRKDSSRLTEATGYRGERAHESNLFDTIIVKFQQ